MKTVVTIGSMMEKKFTRLFQIIDELCAEGILEGKDVLAQVGFDGYESKYYETFDMLPDGEFKRIIGEADLVITHAGTGTVTSCLKQNKKIIIFPRLMRYDEHYDDHQIELCSLFTLENYALSAINKKELIECINSLEGFTPAKFGSNNKRMNDLIVNFIENS